MVNGEQINTKIRPCARVFTMSYHATPNQNEGKKTTRLHLSLCLFIVVLIFILFAAKWCSHYLSLFFFSSFLFLCILHTTSFCHIYLIAVVAAATFKSTWLSLWCIIYEVVFRGFICICIYLVHSSMFVCMNARFPWQFNPAAFLLWTQQVSTHQEKNIKYEATSDLLHWIWHTHSHTVTFIICILG